MNLKMITFFFLCLIICIQVSQCWSSSVNSIFQNNQSPSATTDFYPDVMESIAEGVQLAMDECKTIFKWDKWNCPQSSFSRRGKMLPTKEKAYTNALTAAGIIFSITRNCSQGELYGCSCDSKSNHDISSETRQIADWTWGGCSDDPTYGENIVSNLIHSDESSNSDAQAFVYRHNNRIGTQVVRKTMKKVCKCHGVSGSCSLQTCWMQMSPFAEIARDLREKYDQAILISFEDTNGAVPLGNSVRQEPLVALNAKLPDSLLYLEQSPNYCLGNNATGLAGTKGRLCSRTSLATASLSEKKSCRNLCRACGFKVRKQQRQISYKCNCKFNWCCEVKCNTCTETVDDYFCV